MADPGLGTPTSGKNANTGTHTSVPVTLATTTVGAWNLIVLGGMAVGTHVAMGFDLPPGWSVVLAESITPSGPSSCTAFAIARQYQSGDAATFDVTWTNAGQTHWVCWPRDDDGRADPFSYAGTNIKPGGATDYSASGTTSTDAVTLITGAVTDSGGSGGGAQFTGMTGVVDYNDGNGSSSGLVAQHDTTETAALTAWSRTFTGPSSSIGLPWYVGVLAVAATPQTIAPAGVASAEAVGTPTVIAATPAAMYVTSSTQLYIGHRFAFASTDGEFTLEGLADLDAWAPTAAANCDVWHSSDVDGDGTPTHWVLSHDNSTGRVLNGAPVDISATDWSTLSSYTTKIAGNRIREIFDVASLYPTKILWVENKRNVESTKLLDYLDDLGVLPYVVAKAAALIHPPVFAADWMNNAAARGCPVWAFIYAPDATDHNLATLLGNLSTVIATGVPLMVALDCSADQAAWDRFVPWCQNNGIIPGTHILTSAAAKSTVRSKFASAGGTGQFTMMASDAVGVIPSTPSAQIISPAGIA
jgi:hypothetical protein